MKARKYLSFFMLTFLFIGCNKLQWSERSAKEMSWNEAANYCEELSEGGYYNWRLPSIDELRTIIKNCPATETDGKCKLSVKKGCLSCRQNCGGCGLEKSNGGYYSKLGDEEVKLWSSSRIHKDYYFVDFGSGEISTDPFRNDSGDEIPNYVRCVRK